MEGVSGGVKANVEGGLAVVDHIADLVFVGHLSNQAPGNQFIIQFHFRFLSYCAASRQIYVINAARRRFTLVRS